LHDKSPKTVNNVLATLSVLLKTAVEWELITHLPCAIRLLPVERQDAAFHDFDAYERLLEAAPHLSPAALVDTIRLLESRVAEPRRGEILETPMGLIES
jgi:hypothetical protein